jgi:hypothetical protein
MLIGSCESLGTYIISFVFDECSFDLKYLRKLRNKMLSPSKFLKKKRKYKNYVCSTRITQRSGVNTPQNLRIHVEIRPER